MIVPTHWSEARVQDRVDGRQITVRRFGWSETSEADAQAMAESRAREAFERVARGERLARREPKVPYNGAEGVPIREEVVDRRGEEVVTRNSYGALCLNTPDVLFADVDFPEHPPLVPTWIGTFAAAGTLGWLGGRAFGVVGLLAASFVGLFLGAWLVGRGWRAALRLAGGAEAVARRRVARFVDGRPTWLVNVYRTPNGLRLLALHDTFDPAGAEAQAFFRAVRTDPIYVQMCARQRCFRARVSPKPWRVGVEAHMKPRPGVWPVDPARVPERRRWIEGYERAAAAFASCRFDATLGRGLEAPRAAAVRAMHDRLGRAREALPIA